jgi:transcriptional regulator with XRE-family HTH domain
MGFGDRVKQQRERLKLSQEELAAKLDVHFVNPVPVGFGHTSG